LAFLMGWPIPEIYVQAIPNARGEIRYAVVDGQQQIRSVLQFLGADEDPSEAKWNAYALEKLPQESPFFGNVWAEMSDAARHFAQWMAGETDEDHAAATFFMRASSSATPKLSFPSL
jgi:hypothetical protein